MNKTRSKTFHFHRVSRDDLEDLSTTIGGLRALLGANTSIVAAAGGYTPTGLFDCALCVDFPDTPILGPLVTARAF